MEQTRQPDRLAVLSHLKWLIEPVREAHPHPRLEIAWGSPEDGPSSAKTFRFDQIDDAAAFAVWINSKGCNVYIGATPKRTDTPARGRTRSEHAALATCLPIDIDGGFCDGARKLAIIAKPQLAVITGNTPEPRGQPWITVTPTDDLTLWNEVNRRSVHFSGGDRFALGTYRLMRLAGSVSFPSPQKRARGYDVELTSARLFKSPTHDLRELLDRFPAVESDKASAVSKQCGGMPILGNNLCRRVPVNRTNVALVQTMIDAVPGDYARDFDKWLRVGFVLHDFDAGEIGLALWAAVLEPLP